MNTVFFRCITAIDYRLPFNRSIMMFGDSAFFFIFKMLVLFWNKFCTVFYFKYFTAYFIGIKYNHIELADIKLQLKYKLVGIEDFCFKKNNRVFSLPPLVLYER